jgi:hypothetical protein
MTCRNCFVLSEMYKSIRYISAMQPFHIKYSNLFDVIVDVIDVQRSIASVK